jgi:hypothetical protein
MNHRVYVGPYLRCTTERKPQKITFWGCASDVCDLIHKKEKLPPHVKFCPHCGGPCGDTEVDGPEVDVVRADKLTYITDERLAMFNAEYAKPSIHLFVPNQDWPRDFTPAEETGEILANPDQDFVRHEIEWLRVEYEKEINAARKLYESATDDEQAEGESAPPKGTVEVRWGILGEYC